MTGIELSLRPDSIKKQAQRLVMELVAAKTGMTVALIRVAKVSAAETVAELVDTGLAEKQSGARGNKTSRTICNPTSRIRTGKWSNVEHNERTRKELEDRGIENIEALVWEDRIPKLAQEIIRLVLQKGVKERDLEPKIIRMAEERSNAIKS